MRQINLLFGDFLSYRTSIPIISLCKGGCALDPELQFSGPVVLDFRLQVHHFLMAALIAMEKTHESTEGQENSDFDFIRNAQPSIDWV
jgi:hypothetical protein